MKFADMTTEELYQRIMQLANDGSEYNDLDDMDEQSYYLDEIRMVIDAIEDRINEELESVE
jgi:hypothetical protein